MGLKLAEHLNVPLEYNSYNEHVSDILKWVDLLIKDELHKQKYHNKVDHVQGLMGLVISEDEVYALLDGSDKKLQPESTPALENDAEVFKALMDLKVKLSVSNGIHMPIQHIIETFDLTSFEFSCLAICLAVELDVKYEKLYAYLQDDITRKKPTVDLILNLLCRDENERLASLSSFFPNSKLYRYILNTIDYSSDSSTLFLSKQLKIDEGILNYILGFDSVQLSLGKIARYYEIPAALKETIAYGDDMESFKKAVIDYVSSCPGTKKSLLVHLSGAKGAGKKNLVYNICGDLNRAVLVIDTEKLIKDTRQPDKLMDIVAREALLRQAVLCFEKFHVLQEETNYEWTNEILCCIRQSSSVAFLLSAYDWKPLVIPDDIVFISKGLKMPDIPHGSLLWDYFAKRYGVQPIAELYAASSKYRLTPGQIKGIFDEAYNIACFRSPQMVEVTIDDIKAACRSGMKNSLGGLAQRIEAKYCWNDIVLPEYQLHQLKEICNHMHNRYKVYGEWGFDKKLSRGKGLCVLFSGPPGTGKTMAAEVISAELQLELYRIDLSSVVSKYIGETEKNLNIIFDRAAAGNAILFFDEADALFGKRSEVRDAHDRYANIETAFLLQRMEEYDGIAILATNLRDNMDEAFARRLSHHIEFPFPDEEQRRGIWQVVFPEGAPLGSDVEFDYLAGRLKLSGGSIKNVAVNSAFHAAEEGTGIQLPHILKAARHEYRKISKEWE